MKNLYLISQPLVTPLSLAGEGSPLSSTLTIMLPVKKDDVHSGYFLSSLHTRAWWNMIA